MFKLNATQGQTYIALLFHDCCCIDGYEILGIYSYMQLMVSIICSFFLFWRSEPEADMRT